VLQHDPSRITSIPEKFRTEEMYKDAVKHSPSVVGNFPDEWHTKEMYELAVNTNPTALGRVPEEFLTKELCTDALEKASDEKYEKVFNAIPVKFRKYVKHLVSEGLETAELTKEEFDHQDHFKKIFCIRYLDSMNNFKESFLYVCGKCLNGEFKFLMEQGSLIEGLGKGTEECYCTHCRVKSDGKINMGEQAA